MRTEVAIAGSITVLAVLGAVAALYFARTNFLPLAPAILLTFLLAPAHLADQREPCATAARCHQHGCDVLDLVVGFLPFVLALGITNRLSLVKIYQSSASYNSGTS